MYEMEDVREYSAMTFMANYDLQPLWSRFQPVWSNRVDDLNAPFLSLLNVKYAFAQLDVVPPPQWSVVATDRGTQLLENHNVLPRAFIPARILIGNDPLGAFGDGIKPERFPRTELDRRSEEGPREEANGTGTVTIKKHGMRAFAMLRISIRTPG